jgi:hypothetical protein
MRRAAPFVFAAGMLACGPTYETNEASWGQPVPRETARIAPTAPGPKQAPLATGPVRVLYRADWFGGVTLLGVEPSTPRALVRLEAQEPARLSLDTIDLARGQRVERWEATTDRAESAQKATGFAPLTGTFEADAARFAQLLRGLGPWHMRPPLASPTFAVTNQRDRMLFGSAPTDGSQGDWLYAMGVSGAASKRVDGGLVASYSPTFGPDGDNFAFIGCGGSPCDYGLYLSKIGDDRPRRITGIQRAKPPTWSLAGDSVYTVGARRDERCLWQVPIRAGALPKALECVKGLEDVSFAQDPEGRTGALAGVRGVPGKQVVDITWVLLADGSVLQTHSVERAVGSSVVSASGLMALPMQRGGVGIVDLVTGTSTTLGEEHGWFFGFEGARWVDDSLILLRKHADHKGFEIVAIDVRKVARRDQPWL